MLPVEPYVSRDMAEAFANYSEAQAAAQGGGAAQQRALQAAQQDIMGNEALRSVPIGGIGKASPPYTRLDPGMLNRLAQGGQGRFNQAEAQQVTGMQPPPAPAPGARPMLTSTGPKGDKFFYNHQTGKWEPMGAPQQ
jgi:hypothetical protein